MNWIRRLPRIALASLGLLALAGPGVAAEPPSAESPSFKIVQRSIDAGGGRASSARFEIVSAVNAIASGPTETSASFVNRPGYIGQLNEFPVAATDHFVARPGRPLKIQKAQLLANDTDAEDPLAPLVAIPAFSANGVPLSWIGDWVLYAAGSNNNAADSFTYTVTDGIDISTGTVLLTVANAEGVTLNIALLVQNGNNLLRVFGIPGRSYQIQTTGDLTSPIQWSNLGAPRAIAANGLVEATDIAPPATRFYRAIEP
jgi:hypothetical protein